MTPAWCSGDFTADGSIDVSDFNVWNNNKFTTALAAFVADDLEPDRDRIASSQVVDRVFAESSAEPF